MLVSIALYMNVKKIATIFDKVLDKWLIVVYTINSKDYYLALLISIKGACYEVFSTATADI